MQNSRAPGARTNTRTKFALLKYLLHLRTFLVERFGDRKLESSMIDEKVRKHLELSQTPAGDWLL